MTAPTDPGWRMAGRVLIDKHQADLFYALQIIFEDQLDHLVYTPVGQEWWDQGYWQFGQGYGDDRLARQFLNLAEWECVTPEQAPGCRQYRWHDPHHPERQIRGIELRAVQQTPTEWSHVVATVQDNQQGFARLARELSVLAPLSRSHDDTGTKYVLQVGNTRQDVDWSLDPLALVSSEMPILGRGVLMHQPFDHETTFAYREPVGTGRVTSFVNLLSRIPEAWEPFEALRAALPDHTFRAYGHTEPDGFLSPVDAIAEEMALSDWAYHDKVTGDGFGHIIHNWAAVGRPLIGHARYYRGQLAERFWQDGVTCIDLDLHSVEEAARIIEAITPDRHRAMCKAIRAEFDTIDWASETAEIRALLS